MSGANYFLISGLLFAFIAFMHLLRLLKKWKVNLGGFKVPMWASVVAVLFLGYLAYSAFMLAGQ